MLDKILMSGEVIYSTHASPMVVTMPTGQCTSCLGEPGIVLSLCGRREKHKEEDRRRAVYRRGTYCVWNRSWHSLSLRFQPVAVLMPHFGREAGAVAGHVSSKGFADRDEDQAGVHNQALPETLQLPEARLALNRCPHLHPSAKPVSCQWT